jgi:DNA-binding XRE family transcriptional regulator
MIKTHAEYVNALERLAKDREVLAAEERAYLEAGLDEDQVKRALEPHVCFHEQLKDEVEWYDSVRRGEPYCIETLTDIGKLLIALRIGLGISQREFAQTLGVDESLVSRDEKNEYHGITVRRAADILQKVGASYQLRMEPVVRRGSLLAAGESEPAYA